MKTTLLGTVFSALIGIALAPAIHANADVSLDQKALTTNVAVVAKTPTARAPQIDTPISAGEVVDRKTIAQKGVEVFEGISKIITQETLAHLETTCTTQLYQSPELQELTAQLSHTNRTLWSYEVKIRKKIQNNEFDAEFIEYTILLYNYNKQRYQIKHTIDLLCKSALVEEKSDMQPATATMPKQSFSSDERSAVTVKIDIAELFDKMVILEKKCEVISGKGLCNAINELSLLRAARNVRIHPNHKLSDLVAQLSSINRAGWELEDTVRARMQELNNDTHALAHDSEFMKIARARRLNNDERCQLKKAINELCLSLMVEKA